MINMKQVFGAKLDLMRSAAPQASIRLLVCGDTYYTYAEDADRAAKACPSLVKVKPFEVFSDKVDDWGDPVPAGPPVNQAEIPLASVWAFIQEATGKGHTVALVDVALANRRDAARHYMVGLFRPVEAPEPVKEGEWDW